jgi:uncharacterized protein (DUF1499 family)
MKKPLKIKLFLGAALLVTLGALSRVAAPGNVAQTATNHADPKLRTRRYQVSQQDIAPKIEQLVPTLRTYGRAWKVKSSRTQNNITTVVCEVPVLFFTDDLIVTIRGEKDASVIDAHSSSRVGKSDMGENRRHVLQLLNQTDKKFSRTSQ